MPLTRRNLLTGAARAAFGGLALSGCGVFGRPAPPSPRPSPSRTDALLPVLAAERALLGQYDAVLARHPQLVPRLAAVRADHAAHLHALAAAASVRADSGGGHGVALAGPDAALATLRAAERAASLRAGAACLVAPAPRAALLGSIAACESAHAVLLR